MIIQDKDGCRRAHALCYTRPASLLVLLSLVVSGCRKPPHRVTVIPKTTATDYWESMHDGIRDTFHGSDTEVRWTAPTSESDFTQQSRMVEAAIASHVDGIILAPSHPFVLASAIRHAAAEGIPLVLVDASARVSPSDYLVHVGSDQQLLGEQAATALDKRCRRGEHVLILANSPTLGDDADRVRGFLSHQRTAGCLSEKEEVQYALADPLHARQLTADALERDPALSTIFASEPFAVRGAAAALQSRTDRTVRLVGIAQERDLLDMLRAGQIEALVGQDARQIGVAAAYALLRNSANSERGRQIVTRSILITKDNLDNADIRQLLGSHVD